MFLFSLYREIVLKGPHTPEVKKGYEGGVEGPPLHPAQEGLILHSVKPHSNSVNQQRKVDLQRTREDPREE
jgi:hypothetical protein